MARQLARARLLTMDGDGYAALFNPSSCVKRYESRYFTKRGAAAKGGPGARRAASRSARPPDHLKRP